MPWNCGEIHAFSLTRWRPVEKAAPETPARDVTSSEGDERSVGPIEKQREVAGSSQDQPPLKPQASALAS